MFGLILLGVCSMTVAVVHDRSCNNEYCIDGKCGQGNHFEDECYTGCIDGFGGARCFKKCNNSEFCTACERENREMCTKCKDGYYLNSERCFKCQSNCRICSSVTQCIECIKPWYNTDLKHDCSLSYCDINCACNDTKCVSCNEGFYDINSSCIKQCPASCYSCSSSQTCSICKDGFYNGKAFDMIHFTQSNNCNLKCQETCLSCTSFYNCKNCTKGTYGPACQKFCSIGCMDSACSKDSGSCTCSKNFKGKRCSECLAGMHGRLCNMSCPVNCKNKLCERHSGKCSEGCATDSFTGDRCNYCVNGFFGLLCNKNCPENCQNDTCQKENGTCTSGCKTGFNGKNCEQCIPRYFGPNCEHTCPENCNKCHKENGTCLNCIDHYFGGNCTYCATGYYGFNCNETCSPQCLNETCGRDSGECINGCKGNYSGDKCCLNNGHCDICSSSTECQKCVLGYFGLACDGPCPENCDGACQKNSGSCQACKENFYDIYCNSTCSKTCTESNNGSSSCDLSNGKCRFGCDRGYFGLTCNSACSSHCTDNYCDQDTGDCNTNRDKYSGMDSSVMVSITVPVSIVVVLIIVLLMVWYIRKRKGGKESDTVANDFERHETDPETGPYYANFTATDAALNLRTKRNPNRLLKETIVPSKRDEVIDTKASVVQNSSSREERKISDKRQETKIYEHDGEIIQLSSLYTFVTNTPSDMFEKQFEALPKDLTMPHTIAQKPKNLPLNRFNSIYPYDHSRVTISGQPRFFINACYIDGFAKKKAYIASLGPTARTTEHFTTFWQMVWSEKSNVIVMLTRLHEITGMKCEQYWPHIDTTDVFGHVTVTCRSLEEFAEYTIRTFTLSKANEKPRNLYHLHFTAWPDKGVPDDVTSLIEFRQRVKAIPAALKGPLIVHCSAGIGRTGTYIALDQLTEEGQSKGSVDVFGCVTRMREQRVNMVQTLEQYIFVHKTLVHSLTLDSEALSEEDIQQFVPKASKTSFARKFQKLQKTIRTLNEVDAGTSHENNSKFVSKNRQNADIPDECHRVRLHINRMSSDCDYINAVYINSFKLKHYFIVAQTPLPSTVRDFISMIYQQDCSCIVSLEDIASSRREDVGKYLPVENKQSTEDFIVTSTKCETKPHYITRKLTIQNKGQHQRGEKTTYHFQYTQWGTGKNVPDDVKDFINFIKDIEKYATERKEEKTHILVHCLNGANRSGLFCVVTTLLEKLDIERHVNVENTVRKIRTRRKLTIQNLEQLQFCYQCLHAYLEMYSTYSNFAT